MCVCVCVCVCERERKRERERENVCVYWGRGVSVYGVWVSFFVGGGGGGVEPGTIYLSDGNQQVGTNTPTALMWL